MSVASRDYESSSQLKVFIRLRPSKGDSSKRSTYVIDKGVAINYKQKIHQLYFDGVFDEEATQERIFVQTCKPILDNVLEGCNGALFVYGQTGTGKTYTMGTLQTIKREDQGMIPLSLKYLFESLSDKQGWTISISFLQIYMEDIYDLLNHTTGKLQIREDLQTGETYVENLTVVPISNYKQSIQLINQGLQERKTGPQKMNQLSSRSHTIVSINVVQKLNNTQYLTSNFSLIDLAGSQRVKKSNSTGLRLQEAKFINSSLSALGNVISGLAQNDSDKYIPYRTSKLTRILKNSLSGKSRVGVICTLEPSEQNLSETYSTLLFADRCKQIRFLNQPVINIQDFEQLGMQKSNKQELERLKLKEKQYIETIKSLKQGSLRGETQRQLQLSQIIEMIFKIFGEMNSHLKKLVQGDNSVIESEKPKPVQGTTTKQLKETVRGLAQQTIDQINTLSTMASGSKGHKINSESETLCSIIFQLVRSNLKTYQTQLKQQRKEPLQKQFMAKQYQKQLKQGIINKLKAKKLKIVSSFQQIWAESDSIDQNPLQSLLNNLRKNQLNSTDIIKSSHQTISKQPTAAPNNPKDILKRITKQQSERKQKQLSAKKQIPEQNQEQREDDFLKKQAGESSPNIKYFQKSSVKSRGFQSTVGITQSSSSNLEIKKLLDNLMAQKNQHEERKNI